MAGILGPLAGNSGPALVTVGNLVTTGTSWGYSNRGGTFGKMVPTIFPYNTTASIGALYWYSGNNTLAMEIDLLATNSGFTSIIVGTTPFLRTNAAFGTLNSGVTGQWVWSAAPNVFGTTVGLVVPVQFTP